MAVYPSCIAGLIFPFYQLSLNPPAIILDTFCSLNRSKWFQWWSRYVALQVWGSSDSRQREERGWWAFKCLYGPVMRLLCTPGMPFCASGMCIRQLSYAHNLFTAVYCHCLYTSNLLVWHIVMCCACAHGINGTNPAGDRVVAVLLGGVVYSYCYVPVCMHTFMNLWGSWN